MVSTGKVVGDYRPIFEYWKAASEAAPEKAAAIVPTQEDIELVRGYVAASPSGVSVDDLKKLLAREVWGRVDPSLAREALKRAYGIEYTEEEARAKMAEIVAGWVIEAAEFFGVVELRA